MLGREDVELFCRVGKGTPVGEVFRRHWTPALPASDIARPGGAPVRVSLLGEQLVAFRDSAGQIGVLDEFCSHRGASLALGRNEECGLRCIYHGWKFAVDGSIQETPNMPADSHFKDLNFQLSYPAREAGGVVWVYMGPREEEPPFPHYRWFDVPAEELYVVETVVGCNYLQVLEGAIDSSHVGVLHHGMHMNPPERDERVAAMDGVVRFGGWRGETPRDGSPTDNVPSEDMAPRFEVESTPFGFHYAAIRDSIYGADKRYVRVTALAFPYVAYIPPANSYPITVPLDDVTTAILSVYVTENDPEGALNESRVSRRGFQVLPPRSERRASLPPQDRDAMEAGTSFSGYAGIQNQDIAVQTSMGPMFDRHNEHLVSPADAAVVRYRHLLREEARRVAAGERARFAHADFPTAQIEAGSGIVPDGVPWRELVPGNLDQAVRAT